MTLTSASDGYLTDASCAAFAAGLRRIIGADVRAGRTAGTTALPGGVTAMRLAAPGAIAPSTATPYYALHPLQFNVTSLTGAPGNGTVTLVNTDSESKEAVQLPVSAGIGRVQVPSGDYAAQESFVDFDDQGNPTAVRLVTLNDFTVPDTGGVTTTETVSEARPATTASLSATWYRMDPAGHMASAGYTAFADDPFQAVYVNAQPAAKTGRSHFLVQWQGAGPSTGPRYQYSVAFPSSGIPADETFKVQPSSLATAPTFIYNDPATTAGNGAILSAAVDPVVIASGELSEDGVVEKPGALTLYLGTADGGQWAQSYAAPSAGDAFPMYMADPVTFVPGADHRIDWAHGPLSPSYGQHNGVGGFNDCAACAAGSTLSIGYLNVAGDSEPNHNTEDSYGGKTHFTLYQNGTQVDDQDGQTGTVLTGIAAAPTTYREVFDTDSSGLAGVSQSTKTHTDLSFRYDPANPGAVLPAEDICNGQAATTPCRIQPVLSLQYRLTTDLTNTSDLSTQTMGLRVGHLSYDGQGSRAAITAASVAVSFDGGTTWQPASLTGHNGVYTATWSNPASADGTKPELKVTAADAAGGSIIQTITDAYSIAATTH